MYSPESLGPSHGLPHENFLLKPNQDLDARTVHFTSLGCSKNLVDSEVMLGKLGQHGYKIVPNPEEANVIIVNTCSFIEAAKMESIETILNLAEYKNPHEGQCKALVVSGCMAQRYYEELEKEMPEVDLFIGTGEYHKIHQFLEALEEGNLPKKSFVEIPKFIHTELDPRLNSTPFYTAWLKISEGCNRNCTFCIIPTIRGRLRSRSVESLVAEAQMLAEKGVREINLISQDLSDYGSDLDDQNKLIHLLKGLDQVEKIDWIRLFYFYPEDLSEEVMAFMASSKKICSYLDMPIQHFSDKILRRMNRRVTGEQIAHKIERLRKHVPDIVIRTSVIVGFPGETEDDFEQLVEGIKASQFNHLGVFKYSDEEGTPAFRLQPKVDPEVIEERFETLYKLQKNITKKLNKKWIGKTVEVLVEGVHEDTDLLLQGRHFGQAPDIDGKVIINEGLARPGDLVKVLITETHDYDVVGEIVNRG